MEMTNQAQDGFGKFEETVHELEQAAAEKEDVLARQARRPRPAGLSALAAAVRSRPAALLLIACVAGYALGRLAEPR